MVFSQDLGESANSCLRKSQAMYSSSAGRNKKLAKVSWAVECRAAGAQKGIDEGEINER